MKDRDGKPRSLPFFFTFKGLSNTVSSAVILNVEVVVPMPKLSTILREQRKSTNLFDGQLIFPDVYLKIALGKVSGNLCVCMVTCFLLHRF